MIYDFLVFALFFIIALVFVILAEAVLAVVLNLFPNIKLQFDKHFKDPDKWNDSAN